jgi:integrase
MRTFGAAQVRQLLDAARGDRLEALFVLAVSTGMRQGELLGLQWEDLDFDHGTVQIRHQLQEVAGRLALVEPKTARSRRRVDLPAVAVLTLLEHRERMRVAGRSIGEGYVFIDTEGGPIRKSNLRRRSFRLLLDRAKLPLLRFHDLRHTAATLHLAGGTHPKVVQEMLGHSTISMTLDTYSHVVPSMQKEAAATMNRLLTGS